MATYTLLLSLLSFTVASPLSSRKTFTVAQVDAGHEVDGAWALRQAYLKHGLSVPPTLLKRQAPISSSPKATADVVALSESNDLAYLSPVEIGGQMMKLNFDTGSSDLWVFSDRLPEFQRKNHAYYPTLPAGVPGAPAQLRTITGTEKKGLTWKITYGDGTGASGIVFADKVRIGPVTATAQAVEAATQVSKQFYEQKSDGLLGLGFGKTNTVKPERQRTFFENVRESLAEPLFTATLKKNATGSYDFGFIDHSKHIGEIKYTNVNTTRGYWEYKATSYQIGSAPPISYSFQSIADTGTTLLLLPPVIVQAFYAQVPAARNNLTEGGWVYPCSSISAMPPLTLHINDEVSVTVPPIFLDRGLSATGSGLCFGGVQNGSPALSIWGDIFLKSQFVVFDGRESGPRIGFAPQSVGLASAPSVL